MHVIITYTDSDYIGQRYTDGTPNGHKISCTLEELGVRYTVHHVDISTKVQKEEWFLKINRMSFRHTALTCYSLAYEHSQTEQSFPETFTKRRSHFTNIKPQPTAASQPSLTERPEKTTLNASSKAQPSNYTSAPNTTQITRFPSPMTATSTGRLSNGWSGCNPA